MIAVNNFRKINNNFRVIRRNKQERFKIRKRIMKKKQWCNKIIKTPILHQLNKNNNKLILTTKIYPTNTCLAQEKK